MENVRRKTSMQDIADVLNVSKNAISLALNNKPGISEELRNKVVQTAISMNYGGYGKLTSAIENNLIAICVPNAINGVSQFYSPIYWAVERELGSFGYRSLIASVTKEMETSLILPEVLHERGVKGVIIIGILSKDYVYKLSQVINNLVLVDNFYLDLPLNSVITANLEGGYEATKFLLQQGCKKIGFVGQGNQYNAYRDRCAGYRSALSSFGLTVDESIIYTDDNLFFPSTDFSSIVQGIIEKHLDAVFCASDRLAIQLIGILHKNNISIPSDISIIGFDDTENSDIVSPPLTTMRVPRKEMGKVAAKLLIEQFSARSKMSSVISIYPRLIERKSVFVKTQS